MTCSVVYLVVQRRDLAVEHGFFLDPRFAAGREVDTEISTRIKRSHPNGAALYFFPTGSGKVNITMQHVLQ